MKSFYLVILCMSLGSLALAHPFRSLEGCFEVTYRFAENTDYQYDLKLLKDGSVIYERIDYSNLDGNHTFQHYGIYGGSEMKHWSEEWSESSPGFWTQKVFSPKGQLRYECTAPFVFNQWTCGSIRAPKPTRDAKRTDYEYLTRQNTIQFFTTGWIQMENNIKHRSDGYAISNEVGWNEYRKVKPEFCQLKP